MFDARLERSAENQWRAWERYLSIFQLCQLSSEVVSWTTWQNKETSALATKSAGFVLGMIDARLCKAASNQIQRPPRLKIGLDTWDVACVEPPVNGR